MHIIILTIPKQSKDEIKKLFSNTSLPPPIIPTTTTIKIQIQMNDILHMVQVERKKQAIKRSSKYARSNINNYEKKYHIDGKYLLVFLSYR